MRTLIPWKRSNPPAEGNWMLPLHVGLDDWMNGFLGDERRWQQSDPLALDVCDTDDAVVVRAEIPGVDPKDVDVQLLGDTLVISGEKKEEGREDGENGSLYSERRYGSFRRTLRLGTQLDPERVTAEHKHGVITVTLAKAESTRPRRIEIKG